jgi:hypothetical protein
MMVITIDNQDNHTYVQQREQVFTEHEIAIIPLLVHAYCVYNLRWPCSMFILCIVQPANRFGGFDARCRRYGLSEGIAAVMTPLPLTVMVTALGSRVSYTNGALRGNGHMALIGSIVLPLRNAHMIW